MKQYTLEERRAKYRAYYLVRRDRLYAAGLTAHGKSRVEKVELTFEQALEAARERFWSHVRKDPDGCWRWTAGLSHYGYGKFKVGGKVMGAHCVAYLLEHSVIPDRKNVLHSCDNPPCVNPAHLWVGTQRENLDDMVKKGRQSHGVAHAAVCRPPRLVGEQYPNAKLTNAKVILLRRLRAAGETCVSIAKRLGVSDETVRNVVTGRTWSHVPSPEDSDVS